MGISPTSACGDILLTHMANEGVLPLELLSDPQEHDAWFRRKVLEALDDARPDIEDEDVEARFAERRKKARGKMGGEAP